MRAKNSIWKNIRNIFRQIHLWLGVASALVLTIVCATGTIYVFQSEIIGLLNRDVFKFEVAKNAELRPLEEIFEEVRFYSEGDVFSLSVPASENEVWTAWVRREGERGRGSVYLVNPYTLEVSLQENLKGQAFFRTVLHLHRWLLLDRNIGKPIVGWATIICTFLIISGLVVWVPRNAKYWYKGLQAKFSGKWKRNNYVIHRSLGFYAAIFILIMSLTGPHWSFQWYRQGIYNVLGVEAPRRGALQAQNSRDRGSEAIEEIENELVDKPQFYTYSHVLSVTDSEFPYKGTYRIAPPREESSIVTVTKGRTGFFASSGSDRISMDMITGEITDIDRFSDKRLNEQLAQSIKALHTGEIFGMFTKILYFLSALIATALPFSGVVIWLNRIRK
ncbi:PepSY-associated TM helix domain-containing protein [Natronoflexus pectinivorans]|uniref:Putative iron-regulated membrane protein n=1 Tax=Natronoflexus pectinivorans TaxID=682526 RepID=A0A4R2GMK4_9BACT|nr:PepSY-associated TM helix domain-containing protein [Natronoflexus pectinivorans]TCO10495.1 putative iron-regulated membrane protein [Natronoflexus pectinivorans]